MGVAERAAADQPPGVPGDVLARDAHAGNVAVEGMEVMDVLEQHGVDFRHFGLRQVRAGDQEMLDFAENPRAPLRGTPDHHGVGAGVFEDVFRFFRGGSRRLR